MAWRRHLAFDLDGTLIDSAPDIADAVNGLLAELGKAPLALPAVRTMIGDGAPVLLERAFAASGIQEAAAGFMPRFKVFYDAAATNRTELYPKVRETLTELQREGRRLALCTNKPYEATRLVLRHFGLDALFSAVIGGDSLQERKPAKEPLLEAIRQAGGDVNDRANAVMIGDSFTDLATAKAAAIDAVIIPSGYGRAADATIQGPYHEIARFADLPGLLTKLDNA